MISMASSKWFLILSMATLVLTSTAGADDGDSGLLSKCSQSFTALGPCMSYATGKDGSPSSSCCSSASKIRSDNPVCLCYIIQQTHSGSPTIKSLGLQFGKLLQLPVACKLANSSASDCPKLLKLTPSSPDYNIFAQNATTAGSSSSESANAYSNSEGATHYNRMDLALAFVIALMSSALLLNMNIHEA